MSCTVSRELLMAWFDGEAGPRAATIEAHVQSCAACQEQVAEWRAAGIALAEGVDEGVGEVDALAALARIRERIDAREKSSLSRRLSVWWQELWMFHRRALAGVAIAAALGALSAPAVVYLVKQKLGGSFGSVDVAGVIIESIESQGDTRAVVYQSGGGSTTLIWVEPNEPRAPGDADTNRERGSEPSSEH